MKALSRRSHVADNRRGCGSSPPPSYPFHPSSLLLPPPPLFSPSPSLIPLSHVTRLIISEVVYFRGWRWTPLRYLSHLYRVLCPKSTLSAAQQGPRACSRESLLRLESRTLGQEVGLSIFAHYGCLVHTSRFQLVNFLVD